MEEIIGCRYAPNENLLNAFKWPDVMIDNETLSLKGNAVVVQTAIVPFDVRTGRYGDGIVVYFPIDEQLQSGRHLSESTLRFWLTKTTGLAKQKVFGDHCKPEPLVSTALSKLNVFLKKSTNLKEVKVWCHGIDISWLRGLYMDNHFPDHPWHRKNMMDIYTVTALKGEVDVGEFKGAEHDAYDDCLHQIKYCTAMMNKGLSEHD